MSEDKYGYTSADAKADYIDSLEEWKAGVVENLSKYDCDTVEEVYQKGRTDAIEECISKINRDHTHSAYYNDVYEAIMLLEELKEQE